MASWIDKPQSFNPYVAQLPVEAMVEVGMKKQEQYNEGVEKIQSSINNIAGMDLVRDVDKNYLQTKLNTLTSNLRTVAAGDFSNAQLTNSVMGMTNSLIKDRNIENALYSTKVLRKGQADQELAKKAGKSSPENDSWWNDQASEYINNQDLKATFNGKYIEYRDVDKKLRELGDKIKEIDSTVDLPYLMDGDKPRLDENGRPIINQALLRIRTKGTSAERLVNTFMDNLDEGDKQQLMITGVYHYRGANVDTFVKDTEETYTERKKILEKSVTEMEVKLASDASLNATDRAKLQAEINAQSEKVLTGLDTQKEKDLERLYNINSPEELKEYKYKLYTQKHLTSMASNMANLSVSQTIETNPYFQAEMAIKKLQFDVEQSDRRHREWLATFQFSQYKFSKEQEREDRKEAKALQDNSPFIVDQPIKPESLPTLESVYEESNGYKENIKAFDADYGNLLFPDSINKGKALQGLISEFNTNPSSITDNNQREYLHQRSSLEKKYGHTNRLIREVEAETKVYDQKLNDVLKNTKGINYKNSNKEIFTARELLTFKEDVDRNFTTSEMPAGRGDSQGRVYNYIDKDKLRNKYKGTKLALLAEAYIKKNRGENLSSDEFIILKKSKEIEEQFFPQAHAINKAKFQRQGEILGERMSKYQEVRGTINPGNKEDIARTKAVISGLMGKIAQHGGADSYKKEEYNPETLSAMLKSSDVGFTFVKANDGSAVLEVAGGGAVQKLHLTANEFMRAFPKYAAITPITEIKSIIHQSKNKTTNITGKSNPVGAQYTGWDLPLIKDQAWASRVRVDIEGSLSGADGQYQVRLFYNDPNDGWISGILNTAGFVGEDGLQIIINNIGESAINDLRNKNNQK